MKKQTLIGIGIILLAVAIILLVIFVPRFARKGEMRDRLSLLFAPDPQALVLSDPLYDTADPLNDGREVILQPQEREAFLASLTAVLEGGYRYKESAKMPGGAWDLSVVLRSAEGESVQIFFGKECFYYTQSSAAHYFEPRDAAAYAKFIQNVNVYFSES